MRIKSFLMLLAAGLLLFAGVAATAQNRTLKVQGVVTDSKGETLIGAMV